MDLWIRSQDKTSLIKVNKLIFERNVDDEPTIYGYEKYDNYERLGVYTTKERALEILDEIQSKIKQQFICKIHPIVHPLDAKRIKEELSKEYKGDFILEPPQLDIEPINSQILIYEMPEK